MKIFLTGATGYVGSRLAACLIERGHDVCALVRTGSEKKLPPGCTPVTGNALDASTFAPRVAGCHTFVQLVGTPHPAPWKGAEFRRVDLPAGLAAVAAAREARVAHFVYVSVAHPAPLMHSYIAVREEVERAIRSSALRATILRPWYILGPGHCWPYALLPAYWLAEHLPATRASALRLGLLTLAQMLAALLSAVEDPVPSAASDPLRLWQVPDLRLRARS